MSKVRVLNRGSGDSFEVPDGRTVLAGSREADVAWRNYCSGLALCGTCAVLVVDGELAPPSDIERYFIEGWGMHPGYRLACQAKVQGDVAVISCAEEGFEKDAILAAYDKAGASVKAKP